MKRTIAWTCFFLAIPTLAHAVTFPTPNMLGCSENHGYILQSCKPSTGTLLNAQKYDNQVYEATHIVNYEFSCIGHPIDIGVTVGSSKASFVRTAPGGSASVELTGVGPLKSANHNPTLTAKASFKPGCRLVIKSVTSTPSWNTIQLWVSEAQNQATIINLTRDFYLLARDYRRIGLFTASQLGTMITAVRNHRDSSTPCPGDVCEWTKWDKLLTSLEAMRDGLSPTMSRGEFFGYLNDLANRALSNVETEKSKGLAMVAKFEHFGKIADKQLTDALTSLNNLPPVDP